MIFLNIVQRILYKIKSKFPSAKNSISMYKTGNSILSFLTFFWHIMSKNKLMMKVCLHSCCTFIMGTYLHSFYLIQFYKIRLEGRLPECPRIQYIIRNRKHLWFNIVVNNPILQKKNGKLYIYIRQCFFFLTLEKYHALEKPNSNIWILTFFFNKSLNFFKRMEINIVKYFISYIQISWT